MKRTSILATALVASAGIASASIVTETRTFNVGSVISDPQDPPTLFLETINDSAILSLTYVEVSLHLVGSPAENGFASDMFVSLNLDLGPTSVLLNRVGITENDSTGFFYDGWNVTLRDGAVNGDIHVWDGGSGVLTGTYEPDGRTSPTDTSRPAMLSIFNGSTGNGDWRLAIGDLSESGQMELVSWSLTLSGENTIPEPSSFALLSVGAAAMFLRRRQR